MEISYFLRGMIARLPPRVVYYEPDLPENNRLAGARTRLAGARTRLAGARTFS